MIRAKQNTGGEKKKASNAQLLGKGGLGKQKSPSKMRGGGTGGGVDRARS